MSGGERLYRCEDPAVWRGVYAKYWAVVEAKAAGKQKSSGRLLELEKWYQEELPAAILTRTERSLTHSELVKLMEWKTTRGKFRPRLKQLIGSNDDEAVLRCTKKAFALLPSVLAAGAPGEAAFMADEAVESIAELRPVRYTAKHYSLFLEKILRKTHRLNEADSQQDWTPHKVELCLWACAVANQIQPSLLEAFPLSYNTEAQEEETGGAPSKRRKTK
ncbi:hypothetical protein C0J50_16282 [Silurus asotus]|uniref:Uncharacterized protein n=1 Tax=Silurus asotus TaxID=30991 RepID=A0AAD5AWG8_SILAS|nr:hypothetical protein C0J50_16282 [Silurus asotus]